MKTSSSDGEKCKESLKNKDSKDSYSSLDNMLLTQMKPHTSSTGFSLVFQAKIYTQTSISTKTTAKWSSWSTINKATFSCHLKPKVSLSIWFMEYPIVKYTVPLKTNTITKKSWILLKSHFSIKWSRNANRSEFSYNNKLMPNRLKNGRWSKHMRLNLSEKPSLLYNIKLSTLEQRFPHCLKISINIH